MKKSELLEHAKPFYEDEQLLELEHAIDIASKAHRGQKRKSGEPYITHPLSVASILVDWGMDIDTVLAGVLHGAEDLFEFRLKMLIGDARKLI